MHRKRIPVMLFAFAPLLAVTHSAAAQVKVAKAPAVVEKKTFDPKNRPPDTPAARGNEEGVVDAKFVVTTQPGFTPGTTKQGSDGKWTANVRTQQMGMQLTLKIHVWSPEGMSDQAKAHLDGHRQIVEDVYKTAEKVAAKLGQTYVGRGSKGTGDSTQAAQKDALKTLMESLASEYMAATEKRADRVQEIYDELTDFGAKAAPSVADAIKQATAQQAKEEADAKKQEKKPKK